MKTLAKILVFAGILLLIFSFSAPAADESWTDDFEAARSTAKKEGKHLLLDFTGSDWCGWCIRLRSEVFSKAAFKKEAPKHFVLVELDFPRGKTLPEKIKEQNEELARRFGVRGFPTIILADAEAKVYGRTGYRAGGPDGYVKHLKELRANKLSAEKLFAKAKSLKGLKKARLLDQALDKLEQNGVLDSYEEVIEDIKKLDPKNEGGLKVKYVARDKINLRDFDGAIEMIDAFVAESSPEGKLKQDLFYLKAYAMNYNRDSDGALAALETALQAAPESHRATQISDLLKMFKEQ